MMDKNRALQRGENQENEENHVEQKASFRS